MRGNLKLFHNSQTWSRCRHAFCVGAPDPIGSLPEGSMFVMKLGVGSFAWEQEVFITMTPCTNARDCKTLMRITSKPYKMQIKDWQMLGMLQFGVVFFMTPWSIVQPILETIAGGDLDGNLYLVLWYDLILSKIDQSRQVMRQVTFVEAKEDDHFLGGRISLKDSKRNTVNGYSRKGQ